MVALTVLVSLTIWDKRGAVVGLIAFAVYGVLFLAPTFNRSGAEEWSRQHRVLDAAVVAPLVFLALALVTDLSLVLCVAFGAAAGAVFVPIVLWRRRRQQPADETALSA